MSHPGHLAILTKMYIWQATESQYLTIHLHKHSELLTTNVALLTANVALLTANVALLTANVALLTANVALLTANVALLTANVALLTANVALLTANVVFEPVDSDISAAALIFAEDWHAPFKKFCPACYSVGV